MHMVRNMPRNCVVFLLPRRLIRATVLVRKAKGKPRNSEANLCGLLYSTIIKTSFQPYAFYNKRLQNVFFHRPTRPIHGNVSLKCSPALHWRTKAG